MRENIRQFISELSREEQVEIVHALIAGMANDVKVESSFLNSDGVVVGYYVPYEIWAKDHPMTFDPDYATEEEATEAAKNGRSLSEICAWFNAMHPADAEQSLPR